MSRTIYVIKALEYDAWCYATRHCSFSNNFGEAALFHSKENAEKAIRNLLNLKLFHSSRTYNIKIDDNHSTSYSFIDNPLTLEVDSYELVKVVE